MPAFTKGATALLREAYLTGYAARRMDEDPFYDKIEDEDGVPGLPFEAWVANAGNRCDDTDDKEFHGHA